MSKFNPPIDEVVKKGADIISFGARRMEKAGRAARDRMTMEGFQSAIPGAEGWSHMIEPEKLVELTQPREFNTLGVIDNDVMDRISNIVGVVDDDNLQYVDELVEGVANRNNENFISIADNIPTLRGQINPETLDIELFVDPEQIIEARAYKALRLRDPQRFRDNGMPFDIDWSEGAPWLELGDDWKHSGRVRFLTEDGEELAKIRMDEMNFPFDSDFAARRDPEVSAQWWSNNPVTVWSNSGKATSKYQPITDRDVNEFLRTVYSPNQQRWHDYMRTSDHQLGYAIKQYIEANGINVSQKNWDLLMRNDPNFMSDFLSGQIDPRVTAEDVIMEFGTDEAKRIISGRAEEVGKKSRIAAIEHAADEQMEAPIDAITNHFNVYMTRVREQDPVRYQAMLDFVADSPYRQGNIWPGGLGADHPMLIFHSGKALDLENMGFPGMEMGQFLAPRETGLHAGDASMSSTFANSAIVTSTRNPSGLSSRPQGFRDQTEGMQRTRIKEIKESLPPAAFAEYETAMKEVFLEWLNKMAPDSSSPGSFTRPKLGEMILEKMDPDLPKLLDVRPRDLDPEVRERLVKKYLKDGELDASNLQVVIFNINAHASDAWQLAGRATWPLVFRGKRPFRLRDVVGNSPKAWAYEALQWPGFQQNPQWKARLEEIVTGDYYGTPDEVKLSNKQATEQFRSVLEEAGFDHILYINEAEEPGRPAIVFWDQTLAKPLYGSKGFDKNTNSWANSVLASPAFGLQEERGEE